MANEEQLTKIKEGVEVWNKWRRNDPATAIDLTWAALHYARLTGFDLAKADLTGTELGGANLRGANLRGANLAVADLSGANLRDADLNDTRFADSVFGHTILKNARNLDNCHFAGPCIIDGRTIRKSWPLPESFLRGCGLSDLEIEAAKLLYDNDLSEGQVTDIGYRLINLRNSGWPVQFHSVFISYNEKDRLFSNRLFEDLQSKGIRCWYAPNDIKPGQKIHEEVDRAIKVQDKLLLVLSPTSMNSEWVHHEIRCAKRRERQEGRRMLFPLSLVPYEQLKDWKLFDADSQKDLASELREFFIPDFSSWEEDKKMYEELLDKVIKGLELDRA